MTHRAWWAFKDIFLLSNPVYPSPLDLRDYWDAAWGPGPRTPVAPQFRKLLAVLDLRV